MAIIVDPDNLDRNQVIFGTTAEKVSLYPVGSALISTNFDGYTLTGTRKFIDTTGTFVAGGVVAGSILDIYTDGYVADGYAGHYVIESVDSSKQVTVTATEAFFVFSNGANITYDIRNPTGGSIEDGVTVQALYSFSKEEWRTDSAQYGGDDLIRHEFPFEAITSEQFELGGGAAHDTWEWFNAYTRKKTRTGGWAAKNAASVTQNEYTGIVTLGSLDADTQVYYQQTSDSTDPTNFTFLGPVNEPIFVYSSGDDRRTFLNLFARKKARTYAGSSISDIGVTTIKTIVNRFPLAHDVDTAIVDSDAAVVGSTPGRNQHTLATNTNGVIANVNGTTATLTSSGSTFTTAGVVAGDTVQLTTGAQQEYYTVVSTDSQTQLTINTSESGALSPESSLTFLVTSTYLVRGKTDGVIANVSGTTGTITSAGGGFTAAGIAADDLVLLTEAGSIYRGVYKVISKDSDTQLTLDTTDKTFGSASSINFDVVEPGMYLQYKQETITLAATGNLTFADANPDTIFRASGSWSGDGVAIGDIITITGSVSNDGTFTIAAVGTTTLTLVATDVLVAEGPVAATAAVYRTFKRTISSVVYAFRWRVLGNNAGLADIYQFIQHQLRQTSDIDHGPGSSRGDVTALLMSFASPTGTMLDAIIDDIDTVDTNNVTYRDATEVSRVFPFVAAGSIAFNTNLQSDVSAVYRVFFTNDDAGDNTGRDFGAISAITVQDADFADIAGSVGGSPSVSFTFDYDGNTQRGAGSVGTDAPVTIVAIGLETAQFVITTGTIARSKANNFSLVAALERNYSNT